MADIDLAAEIQKFVKSHAGRSAVTRSTDVAVCLIGYDEPLVRWKHNRVYHPVYIRAGRTLVDACKEFQRANPVLTVQVLAHVWVDSMAHANRLKSALDAQILGTDPESIALNGGWRDLPEWQVAWPVLLEAALQELREGGESIEVMSDEMRAMRLMREARGRVVRDR